MDGNITLLSFNCKGLNNKDKRSKLFKYLKKKKYNICCLQEVHFTKEMEDDLKDEWEGEMFFASYTSNARGVCILFNNNFKYKAIEKEKDEYGNYIIIDFQESVDNETFTLINIYGPNKDSHYFYREIDHHLSKSTSKFKIICGDFNLVQDFSLDREGYDVDYNLIAKSKVSEIKKEHNLDDPFRTKYPQKKNGFTFETKIKIGEKKGQLQKARLDFFLVSKKLLPQIDSVSIEKENLSDSDTETNLSDSDTKTNLSDSDTETNLSDSNTFEPNFSDHFQVILKFNLKNSLKTIFVSSHILPEDQNLCRMQINHNEKWILTENSECGVQKLQLLPSKYHEDLDGGLYDMSSTKSGNLLVTYKEEEIKQISKSSDEFQITKFFKDSQITSLRGIHVTHNGDVLVGSYDKKNKRNSIIRLSSKGEFLKEMYTQSHVLFHRITENVNYDILAIVKQVIVKLLVLDREGRYRFEYSGPKKMKNTFKPRAVVCSVSGHIFIADKGSKCIHLLDKDGKFIQFFLRENVKFPRELALSDSGTLSIGYSNGEIADYYCYMCFSTICV